VGENGHEFRRRYLAAAAAANSVVAMELGLRRRRFLGLALEKMKSSGISLSGLP